ncbi:hypothetical protein [Paludisphaera soli]|uniref:hypothetical protein n=1 Tax=Paludisphaera soli TaxID=2712865 RepID=UPI0013EC63B4|nr:hypothetical protein [Paludisphaera soli]
MYALRHLHCEALVAREFWRGDRRISPACYVALSLSDGEALGWWLDDDVEIWRLEPIDVALLPGPGEGWIEEDGTSFRYPHVDLASRFGIRGGELSRWTSEVIEATAEARLIFADGSSVVFAHDFGSETCRIIRRSPGVA